MARDDDRRDELLLIALGARRRDSKGPRGAQSVSDGRPGIPTPREDQRSDVYKAMSPAQRALYRKFLEDMIRLDGEPREKSER